MKENPGPWDATLALGVVIAALLFSPLLAVLLVSAFVGMSNRLTRFGVSDQVAYVVAVFLAALGVLLLGLADHRYARILEHTGSGG